MLAGAQVASSPSFRSPPGRGAEERPKDALRLIGPGPKSQSLLSRATVRAACSFGAAVTDEAGCGPGAARTLRRPAAAARAGGRSPWMRTGVEMPVRGGRSSLLEGIGESEQLWLSHARPRNDQPDRKGLVERVAGGHGDVREARNGPRACSAERHHEVVPGHEVDRPRRLVVTDTTRRGGGRPSSSRSLDARVAWRSPGVQVLGVSCASEGLDLPSAPAQTTAAPRRREPIEGDGIRPVQPG